MTFLDISNCTDALGYELIKVVMGFVYNYMQLFSFINNMLTLFISLVKKNDCIDLFERITMF